MENFEFNKENLSEKTQEELQKAIEGLISFGKIKKGEILGDSLEEKVEKAIREYNDLEREFDLQKYTPTEKPELEQKMIELSHSIAKLKKMKKDFNNLGEN